MNKRSVESIEKELQEMGLSIEITGELRRVDFPVEMHCNKCGQTFINNITNLRRLKKCPVCNNSQVVDGYNSIADLVPENVLRFFKDETVAHKLGRRSKKEVELKCPDCGREFKKIANVLVNFGVHCPFCSDGVSFPNKILRNLLWEKQDCFEDYDYEKRFDWAENKSYDGYFVIGGKTYAVEMHGEQHYRDTNWSTKAKQQENDRIKKQLLEDNGVELITINCRVSEIAKIKENIINSKICELINISEEEWDNIINNSTKNLIKLVCDEYNSNGYSLKKITEKFKINRSTIILYLKQGDGFGWTDYLDENGKPKFRRSVWTPIKIVEKESGLEGYFYNINRAINFIKENYGTVLWEGSIKRILDTGKVYKGYQFYRVSEEEVKIANDQQRSS